MSDRYSARHAQRAYGQIGDGLMAKDRQHEEMMRRGSEELAARVLGLVSQRNKRFTELVARNQAAKTDIKAGLTERTVREKHDLSATAYAQLASQVAGR